MSARSPRPSPTVVVVEDDPAIREGLGDALRFELQEDGRRGEKRMARFLENGEHRPTTGQLDHVPSPG